LIRQCSEDKNKSCVNKVSLYLSVWNFSIYSISSSLCPISSVAEISLSVERDTGEASNKCRSHADNFRASPINFDNVFLAEKGVKWVRYARNKKCGKCTENSPLLTLNCGPISLAQSTLIFCLSIYICLYSRASDYTKLSNFLIGY
jgi:hypothetical protein